MFLSAIGGTSQEKLLLWDCQINSAEHKILIFACTQMQGQNNACLHVCKCSNCVHKLDIQFSPSLLSPDSQGSWSQFAPCLLCKLDQSQGWSNLDMLWWLWITGKQHDLATFPLSLSHSSFCYYMEWATRDYYRSGYAGSTPSGDFFMPQVFSDTQLGQLWAARAV